MNKGEFGKPKGDWEATSWWTHTPLSYFNPMLSFATADIRQDNWMDVLWQVMGTERALKLVYKTERGEIKSVRIWQADVCAHVAEEIGLHRVFPNVQEGDVVKRVEGAIIEEKPELPKIFGRDPAFELTKDLQVKVRAILGNLLEQVNACQQCGNGAPTSVGPTNATLPWHVTHFKEYEEVRQCLQKELDAPAERKAIINSHGFLFFDDAGEDAAKTLAWIIHGLVTVVLEHEMATLKHCLCPRQEWFLHETKKTKKYFSDRCRFDHHNKVLRHEKSVSL